MKYLNTKTIRKTKTAYSQIALATALITLPLLSHAQEVTNKTETPQQPAQEQEAKKGPPLPLHDIEGTGGIFATQSAYIVNVPRNGEWVGRPSLGFSYVDVGHGKDLVALTFTEALHERIEIGYAYDQFNLGNLPKDIERTTPFSVSDDDVTLHNFNLRLQLLKENDFDTAWIPAVTIGASYKYNADISDLDNSLNGTLKSIGISDDWGIDYTVYASKLIPIFKTPVLFNVGARATKGAQIGLLGFTDDYKLVAEGNVVVFVAPGWALAAEYRQKPNEYKAIPGLVEKEDDWWTIAIAHVINEHATIAVGYGHFGWVLNNKANSVWGVTTKFEF